MDADDDTEHSWFWKANTTHEGSTEFFGWQGVSFQCLQGMTHICSCRMVKKEWGMSLLTNVGVLWLIGQGFTCMNSRAQLDGLGNSYDVCPNIFQKHVSSSPFARWNKRVRVSVSKGRMLAADRVWQGHGILPTKPKHVTSAFHGVEFLPKDCARAANPPL